MHNIHNLKMVKLNELKPYVFTSNYTYSLDFYKSFINLSNMNSDKLGVRYFNTSSR